MSDQYWERERHEPRTNPSARSSEPPPIPDWKSGNGGGNEISREGKGSEGGGAASESVERLRVSMGDTQEGVTCGGCWETMSRRQQVVGLPFGHRHVMQVRCGKCGQERWSSSTASLRC